MTRWLFAVTTAILSVVAIATAGARPAFGSSWGVEGGARGVALVSSAGASPPPLSREQEMPAVPAQRTPFASPVTELPDLPPPAGVPDPATKVPSVPSAQPTKPTAPSTPKPPPPPAPKADEEPRKAGRAAIDAESASR